VGAVHIKDMRKSVANNVRNKKGSYWDASIDHIWTEPGRGEIDLDAVLNVLSGFGGWYVVEVDIADQPTVDETARISAAWLRSRLKGEERGRG
jgi:inosose dehydratase